MKKSFSDYKESGEWDFRDANTKEYTHSFHIYPAIKAMELAYYLLKVNQLLHSHLSMMMPGLVSLKWFKRYKKKELS
jgi:hypothetical protein